MNSYPPEGGYKQGMSPHETYHSWAATQYREKVGVTYCDALSTVLICLRRAAGC